MGYIAGSYRYISAGAPATAATEVQTLTIAATPGAGTTFKLVFEGYMTTAITWSAVNATLLTDINAKLQALPNVGANGIVATAGTLTAGVGTILLTFSGPNLAVRAQPTITVTANTTGVAVTNAETTAGVTATFIGAKKGALLIDEANGTLYQNTGTPASPTWTSR